MGLGQPNQTYPYYPAVPAMPTVPPAPLAPPMTVAPLGSLPDVTVVPLGALPTVPVAMPTDQWVPSQPAPGPTVPPAPTPPPVQGVPNPPTNGPTAPPAPPAPPQSFQPRKGKAQSTRTQFNRMDANRSGTVSQGEFKSDGGDTFKRADRNHDRKVTWREYLATRLTTQSFKQLDRNHDGVLRQAEISGIVTPSGATFDGNADGQVTRKEFLAARAKDAKAVGHRADPKQAAQRTGKIFKQADLDRNGRLTGDELKRHKAYDRNRNGLVSKAEFVAGQRADNQQASEQLTLNGRLPDHLARRLWKDTLGEAQKVAKPGMWLDPDKVAALLGSPVANVRKSLPGILKALNEAGIQDRNAVIAVLATIRTEVGSFMPINEYGGPSYWARYNGRSDLGNVRPGDGVRYHGRGFIQLTGRHNYRTYGRAIGVDLEKNPNKALNPKVAAEVLIEYFKSHGIPEKARQGNWYGVRTAVNGGDNGWDTFSWAVRRLQGAKGWFKRD